MNPPPLSTAAPSKPRGKGFTITAVIIAAIGIFPLLIYLFNCLELLGSSRAYFSSANPLLVLVMGFIGLAIHAVGLICGIVGFCMGNKAFGIVGGLANGAILAVILLFGFIGIAGA